MAIGGDIREVLEEVGTLVQIEGTDLTEYIDYDYNVQVGNPFLREHMRNASFPHDTVITPGDILFVPSNGERLLVVNHIPEMFENSKVTVNSTLYVCNISCEVYREVLEYDKIVYFTVDSSIIACDNHGLEIDQKVNFRSSGVLSAVIAQGTEYFIVSTTENSFEISETAEGTPIVFTSIGSGIHRVFTRIMGLHELTNKRTVWEKIDETYAVFTSSLRGNTSQVMDRQDFADLLVKQNLLYFPNKVDLRTKDRIWISETEYYTVGNVEKRRFNQCSVCDLTEDMRHNNYVI